MNQTMSYKLNQQTRPKYDLFVFGDSLSDIGNLFEKTAGLVPSSSRYFEGRFSNGPLAVEILAEALGLPSSRSTNFAIGGARTDRTNVGDIGPIQFGGLLDEIDQFTAQAKDLGAGAEDLYLVWEGGNDFLNLLSDPANPTVVVNAAVTNTVTAVKALIATGAKNIVVAQTPNLGRTPKSLEAGELQALTAVSNAYNVALATALNQVEQSSQTGTNIILTDLFTPSENIAQNPSAFGFSNVTEAFLESETASDPSQFFFWDEVHPTTRGHSILADVFRNTIISNITDDITRVGTAKNDRLVSFSGNDRLNGRGGEDYLEGNAGKDILVGGAANDILMGGNNRDELMGGIGKDFLQGGAGRDRFIYSSGKEGRDTIADFQTGKDLIDLRAIFSKRNFDRPNSFEAYVRLSQTSQGTVVKVDSNGDLAGGFTALAVLSEVNVGDINRSSFRV